MGITISSAEAEKTLERAFQLAISEGYSPGTEWIEFLETLEKSPSKTYIAGFGAALLAKATDPTVDPLAIKSKYSETSFSLRTICHGVLVPASKGWSHRFSLGAAGREPLNNQPYFRYDHLTEIDRVNLKAKPYLDLLIEGLRRLNDLDTVQLGEVLATFLYQRISAQKAEDYYDEQIKGQSSNFSKMYSALDQFLEPSVEDRPARLQAVVAGLVAQIAGDSSSNQSIYDPSRKAPGDVHVPDAIKPWFSAEVRGKRVHQHEAEDFLRSCARAGIETSWIVVLHQDHTALDRNALLDLGLALDVCPVVIESLAELLAHTVGSPHESLGPGFGPSNRAISAALKNAGAKQDSIRDWVQISLKLSET